MNNVISRLRESKSRFTSQNYARGRMAGIEWAEGKAEYFELEQLDSFRRTSSSQDWDGGVCFIGDPVAPLSHAGWVVAAIMGMEGDWGRDVDTDEVRRKAEHLFGEDYADSDTFAKGFADGALEVWDAVKDQL